MHCSANEGPNGDVSLFFGLSGTGKTTLSADPRRRLIGDDEHCWTDQGIFNIEGGCYAKAIDLSPEKEPEIYQAIRFGTILENVGYDEATREVHYGDASITQNTRASYPIEFIPNAKVPCTGTHPKNVIFLTADAFGVLPPVARLTPEQAMYHFVSGYTAKVAGTEMGVTEPKATFSACFGAAFLVWPPAKYAELLADRLRSNDSQAWLVNTGWTGGSYGVGSRISLLHTRAIIDAIHDGSLAAAPTAEDPIFGFQVPTECAGVPSRLLTPKSTWADPAEYEKAAARLARLFEENFERYQDDGLAAAMQMAAPAGSDAPSNGRSA
jgi:phosphoenolpyruvate carboxykinase (ATP)